MQGLLLVMCSEIILVRLERPYIVAGTEPRSAAHKISTLPIYYHSGPDTEDARELMGQGMGRTFRPKH